MSLFGVSPANRKFLFAIIVAAVILRVCTVVLFHPPLISDDRDYDAIARSLYAAMASNWMAFPLHTAFPVILSFLPRPMRCLGIRKHR